MKILSIIIPVFNTERYLCGCINSILKSRKDFEIILIDDGSNDSSGDICDEYSKIDNRISVFHKKNGGVSSARNIGIRKATGKYTMFVDSDDLLSDDWDKILSFLENDDIYYFDSRLDPNLNKNDLLEYITGCNSKNIFISSSSRKIFSTQFIKKNEIEFEPNIINGEDMLFNIKALLDSNSFLVVNFNYYLYRQFLGQTTRRFNSKIILSDKEFHRKLNILLTDYNINSNLKTKIEDYCLYSAIILILNRISYIDKYNDAIEYYKFLNEKPYITIIIKSKIKFNQRNILLYFCKMKKYKLIFVILKWKNKLSLAKKGFKKENLSIT